MRPGPDGLYRIPQQHLYSNSPHLPRPVFNSMNFQGGTPTSGEKFVEEAAQIVKDEKKKKKKKQKKRDPMGKEKLSKLDNTPVSTRVGTTPTAHSSKVNSKKEEKHTDEVRSSVKKKRKRDSEVNAESPSLGRDGEINNSFLGPDFLKNLKSSIGDIGANFKDLKELKEPKKIAKAKKRKSTVADAVNMAHPNTVDPVKKSAENGIPPAKKQKKKEKSRKSLTDDGKPVVSKIQMTSPYASTPKQTRVPLPQQSPLRTVSFKGSPLKHHTLPARSTSEVLVAETPPSRMLREAAPGWKVPIPFGLPNGTEVMTERKAPAASGNFVTSTSAMKPSSSAPAAVFKTKFDAIEPSSQDALTSLNLLRYTAPLNDTPKPRPYGRKSSISSASSMRIKDAFARMAKPSSTLNTEPNANPFVTPAPKKKETHKEASTHIFTKTFLLSQACVNFTGEQQCLADHLAWRATNDAAGPLPCLKTATGCTPKAEQILRLANTNDGAGKKKNKKDNTSALFPSLSLPSGPPSSPTPHSSFHHAVSSALEAERFLRNAILARVPVPLGPFHGTYALYCPKYSATHVDKYAFGARTLTVFRTTSSSPSRKGDIYTARLAIPPSPVACTILGFTPPPHASLRVTTLTTGAEGYTMGLVCLGNGYVLLRADMGLLLTGKKSEGGRDVCMEFLGVREGEGEGGEGGVGGKEGRGMGGKVEWFTDEKDMPDNTQRVGEEKDMPENTPQVCDEKDNPKKKKRGRPSNVELERRAKEKEKEDERRDYDLWCRECLAMN